MLKNIITKFIPLAAFLGASACSPLSFHHVRRDRLTYDQEVAKGDKEEMLMNIVKLRFADMPTMLRTTQIIAGYSYQRQASGNISGSPWSSVGGANIIGGGAMVSLSDNPTLTYQPVAGKDFADSVLAPIPPGVLVPLLQGDAPIDILLTLMVQSIGRADNVRFSAEQEEGMDKAAKEVEKKSEQVFSKASLNHHNMSTKNIARVLNQKDAGNTEAFKKPVTEAKDTPVEKNNKPQDPLTKTGLHESESRIKDQSKGASMGFAIIVHLMRELQLADAIHVRTFTTKGNQRNATIAKHAFLIFEPPRNAHIAELQDLLIKALDLPARTHKAEILYGEEKTRPDQIPMVTRSLLNVMMSVSSTIQVDPSLIKSGHTIETVVEPVSGTRVPILIHSGTHAPQNTYAKVEYGGYYYWIDPTDFSSKVAFVMLEMISSLATTAAMQGAIVTIPTGG